MFKTFVENTRDIATVLALRRTCRENRDLCDDRLRHVRPLFDLNRDDTRCLLEDMKARGERFRKARYECLVVGLVDSLMSKMDLYGLRKLVQNDIPFLVGMYAREESTVGAVARWVLEDYYVFYWDFTMGVVSGGRPELIARMFVEYYAYESIRPFLFESMLKNALKWDDCSWFHTAHTADVVTLRSAFVAALTHPTSAKSNFRHHMLHTNESLLNQEIVSEYRRVFIDIWKGLDHSNISVYVPIELEDEVGLSEYASVRQTLSGPSEYCVVRRIP